MIKPNIFDNFDFTESELVKFIFLAKSAVSSHSAPSHKLKNNQREVSFNRGEFGFKHQYSGEFGLNGRETVSHDGRDVWGMVSKSKIDDTKVPDYVKKCFDGYSTFRIHFFLKRMLREAPENLPIRGPEMMDGRIGGQTLRYSLDLTSGNDITVFKVRERIDLVYAAGDNKIYPVLTTKVEGGIIFS